MKKMAMLVMTMAVLSAVPAFAAEKDGSSSKVPCTAVNGSDQAKSGDQNVDTSQQDQGNKSTSGQGKSSK